MEKRQLVEIGGRLRQRRTELRLTREQLSELAGIGAGYYGQLEVGTSQMSIDTLMKLSTSLKLSMEAIIWGEDRARADTTPLAELLRSCSARDVKLAEKVLKLFLLKAD
jgi:transcriptional regulator with XRE-family HTH domain